MYCSTHFKPILIGVLSVLIIACQSPTKDESSYGETLFETSLSESCPCDASWFPHSQTPPPAEGAGSPFDTTSTTNCIFQQWSYQKFLPSWN